MYVQIIPTQQQNERTLIMRKSKLKFNEQEKSEECLRPFEAALFTAEEII